MTVKSNTMPFILSNGDVCDDEEIFGPQIHPYDADEDCIDDEEFDDFQISELIDRWEYRLAVSC